MHGRVLHRWVRVGTPASGEVKYDGGRSIPPRGTSSREWCRDEGALIETIMSAQSHLRRSITDEGSEYYYRRSLSARELLPALGVGVGAGFLAFYVAKLFLERTPLLPKPVDGRPRLALRRPADTRPTVSAAGRR